MKVSGKKMHGHDQRFMCALLNTTDVDFVSGRLKQKGFEERHRMKHAGQAMALVQQLDDRKQLHVVLYRLEKGIGVAAHTEPSEKTAPVQHVAAWVSRVPANYLRGSMMMYDILRAANLSFKPCYSAQQAANV